MSSPTRPPFDPAPLAPPTILNGAVALEVASDSHLDGLEALFNDAETMPWLGGGRCREAIARTITTERSHWEQHGFGPWILRDVASGSVIGRGGVRHATVLGRPEGELLYALAFPSFHLESILGFTFPQAPQLA